MKTYIIDTIGEKEAVRIDELLHMLDPKAPQTGRERLEDLTGNGRLMLFVTEHDDTIAGMLTLTYCDTLSRRKYWIEDVIVDEAFRGLGIGRELVQAAVAYVREKAELPTLYLTSNPSRTAARSLYRSEGFEEYETGVFRLKKQP